MPEELLRLLITEGATVATAESCTAGLVAAMIADVAGASDALLGGLVAYSRQTKINVLGLQPAVVEGPNVYNARCALQMAEAARKLFSVTYAISTTGVAGPGPDEGIPAGTVVVGVSGPFGTRALELALSGSRAEVRAHATSAAINFLIEEIKRRGAANSALFENG